MGFFNSRPTSVDKKIIAAVLRSEYAKPFFFGSRKRAVITAGSLAAAVFIFSLTFFAKDFIRAGGLAQTTWPKYGNNERNTSRQTQYFSIGGDFDFSWTFNAAQYDPGVAFQGSPVMGSDGTIYIGGNVPSSPVYAINSSDKSLKWRVTLGDGSKSGIINTIALAGDGNLIVGTGYGLFKLNAANGLTVWTAAIEVSESSPTIGSDGTVYVYGAPPEGGATFFAINPDGSTKWTRTLTSGFEGTPALATDGTIYFTASNKTFWALNADGSTKWTYAMADSPGGRSPMIAGDGTIYMPTGLTVYALNPNGTLKWAYAVSGGGDYISTGAAEASDGTIYFGTGGPPHYVYALNANGTLKWRYETASGIDGGLSVDGQGVIYVSAWESVYALNPGGSKKWQYDRSDTGFSFYSTPIITTDSLRLIISAVDNGTITSLIPKGYKTTIPTAYLSKPPTVRIDSPKNGEMVAGNVTLTYTAQDPDGNGSEFGLGATPMAIDYSTDEGIVGTWKTFIATGKNEGKIIFQASDLGDGAALYFRVVVRDRTDLFAEAITGPIYVDATPPAFIVGVTNPKKAGFVDITVTSTEPLKGAPDVYLNQAGRGKVLAITYGEGRSYQARYEVVQGFDGIATVYITGTDLAGNIGTKILSGDRFSTFVTPPTKPFVAYPPDNSIVEEPLVAFSGTSVPTARVVITVNGEDVYTTKPGADGAFQVGGIKLSLANRGRNIISLVAEDAVGVSEPVTLAVTVNTLPKVSAVLPRPGRTLTDTVRFTWTAEDSNADKLRFSFAYSLDTGASWITTATSIAGTSYTWDTSQTPDGLGVRIRIGAFDGLGEAYATFGPYTLKNDLPVIGLDVPHAAFINSRTVTFKGQVSSGISTITKLEYSLDRLSWNVVPPQDGAYDAVSELFTFTLPGVYADGALFVYMRAEDQRTKRGYRDIALTIDTNPPPKPQLRLDRDPPSFGDVDDMDLTREGIQILLVGNVEPFSRLAVMFRGRRIAEATADRAGAFSVTVTLTDHGKNDLTIEAEDRAGNRSDPAPFTLIANHTPRLLFTFPAGSDVIGDKRTVRWRSDDADKDNVSDFTLAYRPEKSSVWKVLADHLKNPSFEWDAVTSVPSGAYVLRLSGSDGYARGEVIVPIRIDTVVPTIQAALAIPVRTNNAAIFGTGEAGDDFSGIEAVEFALNDEPFTKATITRGYRTNAAAYRFAFPQKLADGAYTLKLRATDRGENVSAIVSTQFTIDTTPPRVGSWRMSFGSLQLTPDNGVVSVLAGSEIPFTIAVSDDAVRAILSVKNIQTILEQQAANPLFAGRIAFPDVGVYPMQLEVADDLGNAKTVTIGSIRVIDPVRIADAKTGEPIAAARVEVYFFDVEEKVWRQWDGEAYSQKNPQTTDIDGAFRYFLPQGTYEIRARASGYKQVKTSPITFEKPTFVTSTIPMEEAGMWEELLQRLKIKD